MFQITKFPAPILGPLQMWSIVIQLQSKFVFLWLHSWPPGACLRIQISSYHYRSFHYKDETVSWCPYHLMEIHIPGQTIFILRWGPDSYWFLKINVYQTNYPSIFSHNFKLSLNWVQSPHCPLEYRSLYVGIQTLLHQICNSFLPKYGLLEMKIFLLWHWTHLCLFR